MGYFTDTAGENVVAGNLCYRKSDGKLWKADADAASTMPGIAIAGESISADATGNFFKFGEVTLASHGFTVGAILYASTAAGGMTTTAPTGSGDQVQAVGVVKDANTIWFFPNMVLIEVA